MNDQNQKKVIAPCFSAPTEYVFDKIDLRVLLGDLELHRELYIGRVFPIFENLEQDAERVADKVLQEWASYPEDFDAAMEASFDRWVSRGIELSEMRQIAIENGFVALFHFLEKWIGRDLRLKGLRCSKKRREFCTVRCLIVAFRAEGETESLGDELDFIRLVANCSKHDEGPSCNELYKRFPETFQSLPMFGPPKANMMRLTPGRFEKTVDRIRAGFASLIGIEDTANS